ncbi:MAG TPA: peptide chain release factor 1, partial [Tepidisphaeraceae bacterium]
RPHSTLLFAIRDETMSMLPEAKLDILLAHHASLEAELLGQVNSENYVRITRELAELNPLIDAVKAYRAANAEMAGIDALIADPATEPDMRGMAEFERETLAARSLELAQQIRVALLPKDAMDDRNVVLEIRAGTGGDEAGLFAGNLYEMYRRYCEIKGWTFHVSDFSPSERGGYKEVIFNIRGSSAYRHLRFEGGGHRVQRVPETEAQGRIHTSAATVAVLPELPDVKIDINPKDVEEFGCRGGGPGGQNVNKVETGWMIKHKPSGLIFKMTEHKSQAQNKERAWALLRATLYEAEQAKQHAAVTSARKAMMGSGDRSQRIRTYNFPQNRCTDHRLGGEGGGEKNFNLDSIMAGNLDPLINALLELDKQLRLENL